MSTPSTVDYFRIGITQARAEARRESKVYRDYEPAVKVTLFVLGPDNQTRVPCGEATFPRCQADVFTAGELTITSRDTDETVRTYQPGEWHEAVCYGYHGDIDYVIRAEKQR
jgi:hypothetical protein